MILEIVAVVPPYSKLTIAEAFDIATIPNACKLEQRGASQCAYAKAAALLL